MSKKQDKPVCGICGVTVPECGSWVKCRIFCGYVCSNCHLRCEHFREGGTITWCAAAYAEKEK